MEILWFLLIGIVAGWLAGAIMGAPKSDLVRNLIVGVIGAFIGGWLFPKFGIAFAGTIGAIIMATGGAIIFIWLLRFLR